LTKEQYIEIFGVEDLEELGESKHRWLRMTWIKTKRIIKEALLYQSSKEQSDKKMKERMTKHQFFIAIFENLP